MLHRLNRKIARLVMLVLLLSSLVGVVYAQHRDARVVVQTGHNSSERSSLIYDLCVFSPDARYVLSCDATSQYILWEIATGREIQKVYTGSMLKSQKQVFEGAPSVSADNRYLLLPGDSAYSLWEVASGRKVESWGWHQPDEYLSLQAGFSANGKHSIALFNRVNTSLQRLVISDLAGRVQRELLYHRTDRRDINNPYTRNPPLFWLPSTVAVSDNLEKAAIGMVDGRVLLLDLAALQKKAAKKEISMNDMVNLFPDTLPVKKLVIAADGKTLLVHTENALFQYDMAKGRSLKTIPVPWHTVTTYRDRDMTKGLIKMDTREEGSLLSDNGRFWAVCENDGSSGLYKWTTYALPGFNKINTVFNANGFDGLIATIGSRYRLEPGGLSNDGKYFFTSGGDSELLLSDLGGVVRQLLRAEGIALTKVGFGPGNSGAFIGMPFNDAFIFNGGTGRVKRLRNWDVPADTLRYYYLYGPNSSSGKTNNLLVAANGKIAVTIARISHTDPLIQVWDWRKGIPLPGQAKDDNPYLMMSAIYRMSADGRFMITDEGLYDVLLNKLVSTATGVFSSDGQLFYELADNKPGSKQQFKLLVRSLPNMKLLRTIVLTLSSPLPPIPLIDSEIKPWLRCALLLKDDRTLVGEGNEGELIFFDITNGKETKRLKIDPADRYSPFIDNIEPSPDGSMLAIAMPKFSKTGVIWLIDVAGNKVLKQLEGHTGIIVSTAFSPDGKRLFSSSEDRTARLWDIATGQELALFAAYSENDHIIKIPEGYYMASRKGARSLHFVKDNKAYLFSQFDLQYNRPDKVLERIGMTPAPVIDFYRKLYYKRLETMGYDTAGFDNQVVFNVPVVTVSAGPSFEGVTAARRFTFSLTAFDQLHGITRLHVLVNGVPVHGRRGIDVKQPAGRTFAQECTVELSEGKNHIAVSAVNEKGVESITQHIIVTCNNR